MAYKNLRAIDLNLLIVLEMLMAEGSVSRAARRLRLTQSGVSRALSRLREHFEDPLFVRVGTSLRMTPCAEKLAAPVRDALSTLEHGMAAAKNFDPAAASHSVKIATADYCEALFLPAILQRLTATGSGLQLDSVATLPTDAERLERGDVDLVIALKQADRSGIRGTKLLTEGFASLVSRDHPLVKSGRMALPDWLSLKHLIVAPHGQRGSPIDDTLERIQVRRTTFARVHGFMAIGEMLVDPSLAATLPTSIAWRLARRYPLEVVNLPFDAPTFDLVASWHERCDRDPAHRWFRALLADVAKCLRSCPDLAIDHRGNDPAEIGSGTTPAH